MRTNSAAALASALLGAMFVGSVLAGPRLPETMVSHWDAAGNPNDTMSKVWGSFSHRERRDAGLSHIIITTP